MVKALPYRRIARFEEAELAAMSAFGGAEGEMLWHNISFNPRTGQGSYLLQMAPGASSRPHRHVGREEFYVIEGELVDFDGQVYRAGDFVSLAPGTTHTSLTPGGCKLLVIAWGNTAPARIDDLEPLT